MTAADLITVVAAITAGLAFARAAYLVVRLAGERTHALRRAFVNYGAAALVVAAAALLIDPFRLPLGAKLSASLVLAAAGAAFVVLGRTYEPRRGGTS